MSCTLVGGGVHLKHSFYDEKSKLFKKLDMTLFLSGIMRNNWGLLRPQTPMPFATRTERWQMRQSGLRLDIIL